MADDGYLIGFEDASGNFVEVGRFNNTADDVTQPIELVHSSSGKKISIDSSGVSTSELSVSDTVNADKLQLTELTSNPSSLSTGDIWYRTDLD